MRDQKKKKRSKKRKKEWRKGREGKGGRKRKGKEEERKGKEEENNQTLLRMELADVRPFFWAWSFVDAISIRYGWQLRDCQPPVPAVPHFGIHHALDCSLLN